MVTFTLLVVSTTTLGYSKEPYQAVKFLLMKSVIGTPAIINCNEEGPPISHPAVLPASLKHSTLDDHVRVADFGTSKNLAATTLVTRPNAMSPKYDTPEQFDSRAVSSCQIPLIKSLPTPNSLSPSTLS
ncbi:hypothetical protein GEMRC1_005303 [Eukaryota sp. GEM-RC1]